MSLIDKLEKIGPVNWTQLYILFGAPLVIFAAGMLVYFLTGLQDRRRHIPGE